MSLKKEPSSKPLHSSEEEVVRNYPQEAWGEPRPGLGAQPGLARATGGLSHRTHQLNGFSKVNLPTNPST